MTCTNGPKKAYRSIAEAKHVRKAMHKRKKGLRIYRCPHCNYYHLTKERS